MVGCFFHIFNHNQGTRTGVALTMYPWHLLCSLGILGDYKSPLYRAYMGISPRGTLVRVHPTTVSPEIRKRKKKKTNTISTHHPAFVGAIIGTETALGRFFGGRQGGQVVPGRLNGNMVKRMLPGKNRTDQNPIDY